MKWHANCYLIGCHKGSEDGRAKVVGFMELYFNNLVYRLWLQDIMKEFVLTVRPGTNKWYLIHSLV